MIIISGGQTGADRAALDFALERGLEIQGYCPHGRRAEDGPLDAKYPLQETKSGAYQKRTGLNVELGDATVIFNGFLFNGLPEYSPGTETAIRFANKYGKPFVVLQGFPDVAKDADDLKLWLAKHKPCRLNVAGNGEEKCPGMYAHVLAVLRQVLIGRHRTKIHGTALHTYGIKKFAFVNKPFHLKVTFFDGAEGIVDFRKFRKAYPEREYTINKSFSGIDEFRKVKNEQVFLEFPNVDAHYKDLREYLGLYVPK